MGIKLVKKSKLEFVDGYFYLKDKLVAIDPKVVCELNELEQSYQEALYLKNNKPIEEPEPYEFKTAIKVKSLEVEADTPLLEEKINTAIKLCEELDSHASAEAANRVFNQLKDLINWADANKVLVNTKPGRAPLPVDTLFVGDPTELTPEKISKLVMDIVTEGEGRIVHHG